MASHLHYSPHARPALFFTMLRRFCLEPSTTEPRLQERFGDTPNVPVAIPAMKPRRVSRALAADGGRHPWRQRSRAAKDSVRLIAVATSPCAPRHPPAVAGTCSCQRLPGHILWRQSGTFGDNRPLSHASPALHSSPPCRTGAKWVMSRTSPLGKPCHTRVSRTAHPGGRSPVSTLRRGGAQSIRSSGRVKRMLQRRRNPIEDIGDNWRDFTRSRRNSVRFRGVFAGFRRHSRSV